MKCIRAITTVAVAGAAILSSFTLSTAGAQNLDDVLQAARAELQAARAENARREEEFKANRNQQASRLAAVKRQVAAGEAESDRLEILYNSNAEEIQRLALELQEKQGAFSELFGAARSGADDAAIELNKSIISGQFPGRVDALKEMAVSESLPSIEQMQGLWLTMLQEMTEQSKVATFEASVFDPDGEVQNLSVTRIGPFAAFSGGNYVIQDEDTGRLEMLARNPGSAHVANAKAVEKARPGSTVRGTIDPTRGALLGLIVSEPNLVETFNQGKLVGKVIAVMAALGVALGLFKWVTLFMTGGAVRSQIRRKKPSKANPLGRVMMAYESNKNVDVETLSLKLDDAILKELPRLESGLNLVKVLAAVAPLLGLLGTVIGMINTFRAITLFGTGDPQLMAGGISEALVTTVLGLIAAIPLLLIHAFASGASRSVSQVIEEQAAGMIAEHAETSR